MVCKADVDTRRAPEAVPPTWVKLGWGVPFLARVGGLPITGARLDGNSLLTSP